MPSSEPNKYTSKLQDARVLVIGGSSGIGFGIAEALIENGASSVIISSSNPDRISSAIQRLESTYPSARGRVRGHICDLSSPEQVTSEVERLFADIAKDGKLDHVIYTAGDALAIRPLEAFSLAEIQQAGMVRFFGPLIVAQHLRKHLKGGPASSYTMTTGGLTERPRLHWTVVMSYLTGLEGMCRALARDLAPIRVNLVGPGPVNTEIWGKHQESGDMAELKARLAKQTVTGQFGMVEDVVESYLYLLKDHNATGSMVRTNGGGLLI